MIKQQIDEKLAEVIELLLSTSLDANIKESILDELYKVKHDLGGFLHNEETEQKV